MDRKTLGLIPPTRCASLKARRAARNAFSLIEVMLALMVISVGILAVLALFPMSMDQNARAVANSHAALFADDALNGIRVCMDENWAGFNPGQGLPVAASKMWAPLPLSDLDVTNRFTGTNLTMATNNYMLPTTNILNHALRYRMALVTNGNIKAATLWVWSGQYGTTNAPIVFYAEFFNLKPGTNF